MSNKPKTDGYVSQSLSPTLFRFYLSPFFSPFSLSRANFCSNLNAKVYRHDYIPKKKKKQWLYSSIQQHINLAKARKHKLLYGMYYPVIIMILATFQHLSVCSLFVSHARDQLTQSKLKIS